MQPPFVTQWPLMTVWSTVAPNNAFHITLSNVCTMLQVTYDVLPGVAELLPNSPILRQEWQHVRMALEGHQQKIKDAKDKQQILLSNPSNLSNEDLRAAGEAIEQLLKELDAQRNAFVHYTNRILQV